GDSAGELSTALGEKLRVGLGSVVGGSVVGGSVVSTSLGDCSGLSVGSELSLGIGAAVSVGDSLGRSLGRRLGDGAPPAMEDTAALTLSLPSSVHDAPNRRTADASTTRPANRATRPTRSASIVSNPMPSRVDLSGAAAPRYQVAAS